jgi:hypothetical protein
LFDGFNYYLQDSLLFKAAFLMHRDISVTPLNAETTTASFTVFLLWFVSQYQVPILYFFAYWRT